VSRLKWIAQGKYALERLIKEVDSEYFPTDVEKAVIAFKHSPLLRARNSLIRNFIIVLLKKLLYDENDYTALNAVERMHKELYDLSLTEKLSSFVRNLDDGNLSKIFPLLKRLTDCWSFLEEDVKQKLETYVDDLHFSKLEDLEFILICKGLSISAEKRLKKTTREELAQTLFFDLPNKVGDRIVNLYDSSGSFDQANSFASTVKRYALDFTNAQIEKIIEVCGENSQIKDSLEVGAVINAVRGNKSVNNEQIDKWLNDVALKEYVKKKVENENLF
jgi:hypothetical protein